jgi:DNA-binding transcriptional MocR family regulator
VALTSFHVDRKGSNTLRRNFSCPDESTIIEGVEKAGRLHSRTGLNPLQIRATIVGRKMNTR